MIQEDRRLSRPPQGDTIRDADNERREEGKRDQVSLSTRDENGLCTNASALFLKT